MATSRPRIIGVPVVSARRRPPAARGRPRPAGLDVDDEAVRRIGGVARRQLEIRSVRSSTSSTSASRPHGQRRDLQHREGRPRRDLARGQHQPARARRRFIALCAAAPPPARPANSSTAAAKPPTAMGRASRSLDTSSSATQTATPAASTASARTPSAPTSRRITRSGGTCASCSTGGRPKANSSVKPTPRPNSRRAPADRRQGAPTSPASSHERRGAPRSRCATPSTLANSPTPNSNAGRARRCAAAAAEHAQHRAVVEVAAAKSRAAMPTATAASSAASSATRLRNFSARSSVWRISPAGGHRLEAQATQARALISSSAHCTKARTGAAGASARDGEPVGHAAGRLDEAGGRQVGPC